MNSYTEQNLACIEYRTAIDLLMRIPLFSVIPIEALKVLACLGQTEHFEAGEVVFQQGEIDDHAYCILEGEAELLLRTERGNKRYGASDREILLVDFPCFPTWNGCFP